MRVALLAAVYLGGIVLFVAVMSVWFRLEGHGRAPARLWRAAAVEAGWAMLVELLLPLALVFWPPWWQRRRRAGEVPILFVHGYAQNRADFLVMAARLARRGRGSLFAVNYWPFASISISAARLARAVARLRARTGAARVHLIAHSLGGVVCRHFIEQGQGSEQVASLIAVATPFGGTARIGLGLGACATELCPGSKYLLDAGPLRERGPVRYHAIWSLADAMVVPPEGASLKGTGPEHRFDDAGHLTLLTSRESAEVVARWLAA